MNDKNSAVNEFLNQTNPQEQFETKDQNPFANITVEQKESEPEVNENKEEEKVPFHKDPKVQRYIQKEIAKATQGMTKTEEKKFREDVSENEDLVSAFTQIIGNDTFEKQNALKLLKKTIDDLKEQAQAPLRQIEQEKQAELQAEQELAQGFESIEETYNVDLSSNAPQARKLRSDFVDFIMKIAPKDKDGDILEYPDFTETFNLFMEINKKQTPSNARNKQLSSRSMTQSSETSAQQPQDTSWKGVEKFLSGLKG